MARFLLILLAAVVAIFVIGFLVHVVLFGLILVAVLAAGFYAFRIGRWSSRRSRPCPAAAGMPRSGRPPADGLLRDGYQPACASS